MAVFSNLFAPLLYIDNSTKQHYKISHHCHPHITNLIVYKFEKKAHKSENPPSWHCVSAITLSAYP